MNLNIKQRIKLVEKQIGNNRLKPHKPGLIDYDTNSNTKKYFIDEKEFTREELDKYLEQFEDQNGLIIYRPKRQS